jgi:hypothetical protein
MNFIDWADSAMHRALNNATPGKIASVLRERSPAARPGQPPTLTHTPARSAASVANEARTPRAPAPPGRSPQEDFRWAVTRLPLREVVKLVIEQLIHRQSFGSPLTVLEEEYRRQMTDAENVKSALYTAASGSNDAPNNREAGASPTFSAHGLTRDELQERYLLLHSAYTKQAMELVAREERIARLCDKVTELSQTVHQLKKTVIAATTVQEVSHSHRPTSPASESHSVNAVAEHDHGNAGDVSGSPYAVIDRLQNLNVQLSQRIETLEHNVGAGWIMCDPQLSQRMKDLQDEVDRLTILNSDVATAYLTLYGNQHESTTRAESAEAELALMTRRRDQAEKEVLALRVALERSRVDSL